MNFELLKNCGTLRTCRKGAYLCREGGTGGSAFIVLKGKCTVALNSFSESPKILAVVEPGSFVGEMSLFLNKPRTASVVAREPDTVVLEIKPEDFKNYLAQDPQTCYKLVKTLVARIKDMCDKMYTAHMRFIKECREDNFFKLADQMMEAKFVQMATVNPDSAVKLIKNLCTLLATLNDRYMEH